jgi:DNA-binding response OmpR family regulator
MRVLVVEDEARLASALARGLEEAGFEVSLADDGSAGYRMGRDLELDVIVLDLMLPGLSGLEVCRRLRADGVWTPILVLTAKDQESDETDSLDSGADDYLRKPFSFSVLVSRCRALARRGPVQLPAEVRVGDLVLDPRRRAVRRGQVDVPVSRREFALVEYLAHNVGKVCSKEEILGAVWGVDRKRDPNVVEVYVGYLRRKLDEPFGVESLVTVRGRGYVLRSGA